ncbi:MAG TPA: hypothetical protein PLD81_06000 [Elusimicrobiales bacterium]|nr:hypothetical protein [Elusimicrobiales bacterium]HPO95549.1 hypothetical protein [Elusimicrobiales bacterium]
MNKSPTPVIVKKLKKVKKKISKIDKIKTKKALDFLNEDFTKEINDED